MKRTRITTRSQEIDYWIATTAVAVILLAFLVGLAIAQVTS